MAEDKKPSDKTPAPTILLSPEIEIELGDERNRVFAWAPTMEVLRGAWRRTNLRSDELVEDLATMPDIPGMKIRISTERKTSLIYDPLSHPDNKQLCDKIAAIIFARFRERQGPAKAIERKDMNPDEMKTWLYCMARRRDAGQCKVTVGDLPSTNRIEELPGRIRIESFNSSSRACKWKEEFDRYVDAIMSLSRGVGLTA